MTTNQTIDGVPRELVQRIAKYIDDGLHLSREERDLLDELRALLDAPAKPVIEISLELLNTVCNGFFQEQGHALNELREILSAHRVDQNVKSTSVILDSTDSGNSSNGDSDLSVRNVAAQPQCEPVCYLVNDRYGGKAYLEEGSEALAIRRRLGFTDEIPLYAEQPAPVAVDRPAHANPPPGTDPCGTHHDNDGLDEMRKPK